MAVGTAFMFTGITHESLWYDESYTAALMNHSFKDIIEITGTDSHPPLYYIMLRIFSSLFGRSEFALKAFSVIGTAALAALGFGPIRRAFDNKIALIYSFLVFALPISLSMSQEARMYTWAAFFVTGTALYGYLAFKESKIKDWITFGLYALFAAYTHYYALLAVMVIFGLIFLSIIFSKMKLTPFLITSGVLILGYLPWIFKLALQVERVSGSFWIPPVDGTLIKKVFIYPFSNKFSYHWSPLFVEIAFYVSAAFIIFGIVYKIIKKDSKGRMALLAIGGYTLTIIAGIIASYIIRPVLVERYIMCVFGLFVIGIAYGIGSLGKKVLPIIGCIIILAFSIPETNYTINYRFSGPMYEAVEYMETHLQDDDVFVHTDEHTLGTFCYYFPDNKHFYYQKDGTGGYSNYDAFLPNGVMIDSLDEIENADTVWVIQRYWSGDTTSFRQWISSGKMKYAGAPKDFKIDPSWYGFTANPMELTK